MTSTAGLSEEDQKLEGFLSSTHLEDMVKELDSHNQARRGGHVERMRVTTLNHNTTVGDALKVLASKHILSAPVVIEPDVLNVDGIGNTQGSGHLYSGGRPEPPTLLGFFDVQDALRALLAELKTNTSTTSSSPQRSVLAWMRQLEQVERSVTDKKLISVLGDDAELFFKPNIERTTLLETIRDGFLGKHCINGSVHRIAIFDCHGEIVRIVSMSDVVCFLAKHKDKLGGIEQKTIKELGFIKNDENKTSLITVSPTIPAIEAFSAMNHHHVSGLGITDGHQELIANLSASDLRYLQSEHFGVLGLPVAEYLALLHGTSYAGFSHQESTSRANPFFSKMNEGGFRRHPPFLISCTPRDTVAKLLDLIVMHKIHRVYVCESEDSLKPIGTITLTDILRCVSDNAASSKSD